LNLQTAGEVGVVADDLGVVPDYVRPLLQAKGIPGFSIPLFEREEPSREFRKKEDWPEMSLATYATHDHQPLRAWYEEIVSRWTGPEGQEGWKEMQRLMRFLGWDEHNPPRHFTPELHEAFVRTLVETPCWLAVFMITDILGTTQRFNQPGSSSESNWSQRLEMSLEKYAVDLTRGRNIRAVAAAIHDAGRDVLRPPTAAGAPSREFSHR
jgi:4-alpha-glucanotransferase